MIYPKALYDWIERVWPKRNPWKMRAHGLYARCVAQSRLPIFYTDFAVPDEKGARFELLNLHVLAVYQALAKDSEEFAQTLFDTYILMLDNMMREDGVGDLTVPKKMKKLLAVIYARLDRLRGFWANPEPDAMCEFLQRTLYAATAYDPARLEDDPEFALEKDLRVPKAMADYVQSLSLLPTASVMDGEPAWPDILSYLPNDVNKA